MVFPHPATCPLCDQADEDIQHILVSCVFARQVLFILLQGVGLGGLTPRLDTACFSSWLVWCYQTSPEGVLESGKVFTLLALSSHGNYGSTDVTVFGGTAPSVNLVVRNIANKGSFWCMAGGKGHANLLSWVLAEFLALAGLVIL